MSAQGLGLPVDLAYLAADDAVYLATVPQGPIRVLAGSAAVIWEESLAGDRPGLTARVAQRVGADVEGIGTEVEGFVATLLSLGLLAEVDA